MSQKNLSSFSTNYPRVFCPTDANLTHTIQNLAPKVILEANLYVTMYKGNIQIAEGVNGIASLSILLNLVSLYLNMLF